MPNLSLKNLPNEKVVRGAYLGSLISACGLSQSEAGEILGIQHQSVRQKVTGNRTATDNELLALAGVLDRIREGDVEGLPDGACRLAAALAFVERTRTEGEQDAGRDDDHDD